MPNTTTSPNMGMSVPVVGVDPGPDWATNINSCLSVIDGHDHTPGSGVQLTPNSLNINADLPLNNNNLTTARSVRFQSQSSNISQPADVGCLYEVGADLWYNDGSGNQIRFTQGGSIVGTAGSITGLPSGTASASYAAGTFVWQSATNTSAVMDFGSAILRNNVANSKGLTLSPPNAMGADYGLTLPSLPGVTSIMSLDPSGNMNGSYTVDNSTIVISANVIQIPTDVSLPGTPKASGGVNIVVMQNNNPTFPDKPLNIVRGWIDPNGGVLSGEGFTFNRISAGLVTITFNSPFQDVPAISATADVTTVGGTAVVDYANPSTTSFLIRIFDSSSTTFLDRKFSFIAIGLRA